jgi:hypothetical protein
MRRFGQPMRGWNILVPSENQVETENTNLNLLYRRKLYLFNSIIIQQYTMKLALILILAVIFWWLPLGWAQAADLKYVRAGEHGSFTRVVFEFEGMVRSTEPTIIGRGIFNVIFFDMTTALPRQILNKTTKGIQSVELIQEKSRLTANITLSFPDFKLKTFSLSNPDRFIIDAYRMSSPPKTSELVDSLQAGPLDTAPDTEESLHAKPDTEEPLHAEPDKVVLTEPTGTDQMIRTKKSSIDGNYNVQIYLLALLNILTLIIVALLSLNLWRRRPTINSERLSEVLESLEKTDERVSTIDALIKKELEKLNQS